MGDVLAALLRIEERLTSLELHMQLLSSDYLKHQVGAEQAIQAIKERSAYVRVPEGVEDPLDRVSFPW